MLVRGAGVYHAVRMQAGTGQAGGEQIVGGGAPQHAAVHARQDAGGEQGGAGTGDCVRPAAFHLVQRTAGQAAFREVRIDFGHAKARHLCWACRRAFKHTDAAA